MSTRWVSVRSDYRGSHWKRDFHTWSSSASSRKCGRYQQVTCNSWNSKAITFQIDSPSIFISGRIFLQSTYFASFYSFRIFFECFAKYFVDYSQDPRNFKSWWAIPVPTRFTEIVLRLDIKNGKLKNLLLLIFKLLPIYEHFFK